MKKIVVTLTIAYILGIVIGLYKTISIILFFLIIFSVVCMLPISRNIIKRNKYKILIYCICIFIGIFSIKIYNNRWNSIYNDNFNNLKQKEIIAEIINLEKETKYQKTFKIKILNNNVNGKFFLLKINVNNKLSDEIKLGMRIYFYGDAQEVQVRRNFGGFDYQEYLKSKNLYGVIRWKNGKIIKNDEFSKVSIASIKNTIIEKAYSTMNEDHANFFLALSIGYRTGLSQDIKESFSKNNLSHMLAISGMHISYILIIVNLLLKPFNNKLKSIITIIVLIFFMQITGNAPSVSRSCVVLILSLIAPIFYRKSDTSTNLAISAFFILINNPYSIKDESFLFSYIATIGIIYIYPIIKSKIEIFILTRIYVNKTQKVKQLNVSESYFLKYILFKIKFFIKETIAISIASNIVLIPLLIYKFNSLSLLFIISNLLITPFFIISVILSFIILINIFFSFKFNLIICNVFSCIVDKIILINNFLSGLSFFNITCVTPNALFVICVYVIIVLWVYLERNNGIAQYIFSYIKQNVNLKRIKNIIIIIMLLLITFAYIYTKYQQKLRVYFVDVGQGDCTLIITPNNKKVLIDGGGNESSDYDIGKRVLLPYLLDRRVKKIDYIIISHFDSDHVAGLFAIMENLKIGTVVISKQGESSENYEKFKEIVRENKIKVVVVGVGDKLKIDKEIYFDILWPNSTKLINKNILNNNSIVCKLHYRNFSMLFTGDIEEIAERDIIKEYKKNLNILNSTILKVAHHGSKSSSIQEIIQAIKPKIAVIGVGVNNKFGHPNDDVIKRLENIRHEDI